MAIVFAAVVPHSPLFIPRIGKESLSLVERTVSALRVLCQALVTSKPDALLIISPHAKTDFPCLSVNIRPDYDIGYDEFGDFGTRRKAIGALALGNALKRPFDAHRRDLPLAVSSQERLDYGCTTPLYYLLAEIQDLPILPLGDTVQTLGDNYTYGQQLRTPLVEYPGRIALVASANLSHRLSSESPAGFSSRAKAFDQRTRVAIRAADAQRLARVRAETVREVDVCGLGPLLLLFGMLHGARLKCVEMSYEAPFGIGFGTFRFHV